MIIDSVCNIGGSHEKGFDDRYYRSGWVLFDRAITPYKDMRSMASFADPVPLTRLGYFANRRILVTGGRDS